MDKRSIFIVDDHQVVRKGLIYFFKGEPSVEIAGEASDGREALDMLKAGLRPDVMLLDLNMPGMSGVEVTAEVKRTFPDIRILVLTSFEDEDHVIRAVQAGADGYCLKDTEPEELLRAIHQVAEGTKNIDPKVATHLFHHVNKEESDETRALKSLTRREREVLLEIALGHTNVQIAERLFISEKTVKTHITNLFSKLPCEDRTQAALLALRNKQLLEK
ncbi:response regulator [Alteribacter natronophilus]|uniref:response regulator n=1 Tax=Alteribacter natronophilus TaxID=2583810 RepID=UPI00110E6D58|nr:response regulator transcription factor [Alteribacter natronophilus]TMW70304.1 response regulator transcription factor [Alteribacter natronophilus]